MIFSCILGFISGVAIGSFFNIDTWLFIGGCFLTAILFIYKYLVEDKDRKTVLICVVFLASILLGIVRVSVSDLYSNSGLDSFVGKKIEVTGIIVDEPDVREKNTKLTVKLVDTSPGEKILVTTSLYPEWSYGDKVKMDVVLQKPKLIESEDGRVFDYEGYLRVRGIWYTSSFTKVTLVSSGNGNSIKALLFKIKHKFTESLDNALPQPESSLMAGLLLGSKQSLGKELLSEFQRTGTSHIVVLSGYNIAIVAESIMNAFKFLPKNFSFGMGAVSIILFTILSGGSASAWRASIMVLVALFAKKLNRDYKASRVLGFTIVLMLAPNPLLLAFDPSFQLSVLATIGLIFVSPLISTHLTKITEKFSLREIVSTTIATQITVLPYLIYNMGLLSLVSLPVNILILGTIPITMFFGFITGLFGLISLYLSFIPALPAYVLLWYQLKIVHLGSSLSFGAITLPAFSPFVLFLVYLLIFIGIFFTKSRN